MRKGLAEMPGQVVPAPDDDEWAVRIEAPRAAAFTRRFFMRDVNHEAVGLAGTRQRTDVVLTHGLPNSTEPERAAYAAARSGLDALDGQPGGDPVAAIRQAFDRAAEEIRDHIGWDAASPNWGPVRKGLFRKVFREPPGTTWLAVRVVRESSRAVLAYGWVGHSRVYWLPRRGTPELLTTDHYVSFGQLTEYGGPSGMLERWLDPHRWCEPDTGTSRVTGPGLVVLATGQVWRQFENPKDMADRLGSDAYSNPARAIDQLVDVDAPDIEDRTIAVVVV